MAKKKKQKKSKVEQTKKATQKKINDAQAKPTKDVDNSSEKFIDHLNTIFRSQFSRGVLSFTILLILGYSLYSYTQHKLYQGTLVNLLPADTTFAFLEVNQNLYLDQVKRLSNHKNQEEIRQLIDPETSLLNQTNITPVLNRALKKNLSIQYSQDQKKYLFLYKLLPEDAEKIKFPVRVIQTKSDQKWYYSKKGDILSISNDKTISKNPFQELPKFTNQRAFLDSSLNIPQQNLAWFSINHSFIPELSSDPLFPNNKLSSLKAISPIFGFTSGYFNVNTQGLLVGTYTNPNPNLNLTLSPLRQLDKFQSNLQQYTPPLQSLDFIISGTEISTMTQHFTDKSPEILISLQNIATRHNLSPQNQATIQEILQNEYLVYKQEDSYSLLLPKQNPETETQILDIFSNLEAYYSPTINSYLLEDNTRARTKVPSEPVIREPNEDQLHTFNMKELSTQVHVDFSHPQYIQITYNPPTTQTISQPKQTSVEPENPDFFQNLLPQGSSHIYMSQDQVLELITEEDLSFYPFNVNSSTYFFDDGIQALFQLTW